MKTSQLTSFFIKQILIKYGKNYKMLLVAIMSIYERIMEFRKKYPGGIAFRLKKHAKVVQGYLDSDEEILYAFEYL